MRIKRRTQRSGTKGKAKVGGQDHSENRKTKLKTESLRRSLIKKENSRSRCVEESRGNYLKQDNRVPTGVLTIIN